MPKAFTHLCKKVNLSLYNDTLTVYPKPTISLPPIHDEMSLLLVLLFSKMDCVSAQVDGVFMEKAGELGIYRFVHRDDSDHYLYHQDAFEMEANHYHAQFAKIIDETKLENILSILEKYSVLTSEEHQSFIKAYHEANTLPSDVSVSQKSVTKEPEKSEKQKSITLDSSPTVTQKPSSKEKAKDDTPTFAGLKRGFFQTTPATSAKNQHESQAQNLAFV